MCVTLYVLDDQLEMYTLMNLAEYLYKWNVVKRSGNILISLNMEVPAKPLTAILWTCFTVMSKIYNNRGKAH